LTSLRQCGRELDIGTREVGLAEVGIAEIRGPCEVNCVPSTARRSNGCRIGGASSALVSTSQ
jgi:hypothetical protein